MHGYNDGKGDERGQRRRLIESIIPQNWTFLPPSYPFLLAADRLVTREPVQARFQGYTLWPADICDLGEIFRYDRPAALPILMIYQELKESEMANLRGGRELPLVRVK